MALARIARARGLILLIGLDEALAAQVGADGVHLPERALGQARRIRMRHPRWLITGAAHSLRAARRAKGRGLDAALVSPVFASRSPSAGRPLGVMRFSAIARRAGLPVIALGGVNARTARRLADTGAWGLAAVDVFAPLAGRQGAA